MGINYELASAIVGAVGQDSENVTRTTFETFTPLPPEEIDCVSTRFVKEIQKSPTRLQTVDLLRRIREYETIYNMSSAEMLEGFKKGSIKDSPEVACWLMLLDILGK